MIKGPFLWACLKETLGFPGGSEGKASAVMRETQVQSLGREDPLEKEMATHSSILVWRIPWMEVPGGLQSTGSQRVGHDWVTTLYTLKEIRSYAWRSLLVVQGLYTPGKISKSQLTPFISCTSRCLIQGKTLSQPPEFGGGSGFVKRQEISQVFGWTHVLMSKVEQ